MVTCREHQYFEKGHSVDLWIKCFYSLKVKSYDAELKFAQKINNPVLKIITLAVAYEHKKIAEILKALFKLEETINPYSEECKKALGASTIEDLVKARDLFRKILRGEKLSENDVNELVKTARRLADTMKGTFLSLAKIAQPPASKILMVLAESYGVYYSVLEKYLMEELKSAARR